MSTRLWYSRLDPAVAEVHFECDLKNEQFDVEARIIGPRCRFASTVEVAYPMRLRRDAGTVVLSTTIPEPCFWDPESPFLYEAKLQWRDGAKAIAQQSFWFGIRTLALRKDGLRMNGRPISLRGVACNKLDEQAARDFRAAGINLLLVEPSVNIAIGSQFGLLALSPGCPHFDQEAGRLGWLISEANPGLAELAKPRGQITGLDLRGKPIPQATPGVDFVLCDEAQLPKLDEGGLPKLVQARNPPDRIRGDVFGYVGTQSCL